MNIKRAKEEIERTVKAYLAKDAVGEYAIPAVRQRPILLMGPPGIGKTQIMEQAARDCGVALVAYTITHHTRQSAVGLPFIRQKHYGGKDVSVTEYTMSEIIASIYEKMEATGLAEGILFIDEINCVSETLAPTMLQFLQCKTFGNQAVPAGWIIVAAGNPPEYNKSVRDFDIVTLDRVRRMDIEPDLPAWREYAREVGVHGAILSYLELHPQNFYQINADVEGTQFVTARGWEDLSNLLDTYEALGMQADEAVIRQYIQHGRIAEDFAAYLDLYYKYRDGKPTSTNPVATIFAWSGALAKRAQMDGNKELAEFAAKLEKATIGTIEDGYMTGDLAALYKGDKEPVTMQTEDFLKKIAEKLG